MEHMLQYRRQYEGYLGEEFGHYTEAMARSGTWGDELTLVRWGLGCMGGEEGGGRASGTLLTEPPALHTLADSRHF